jgi:adenine phosphoribosyltransferase
MAVNLPSLIRDIPDFPKKGIIFKDITTLLSNREAFRESTDKLAERFKDRNVDQVIAVESRGFVFGGALAYKLNAGFVPIRKKGALPWKTYQIEYELEYGKGFLEIHQDALPSKSRVLLCDDLLATGGTMAAMIELVNKFEVQIVGVAFLIELTFLKGREKLKEYDIHSLIEF